MDETKLALLMFQLVQWFALVCFAASLLVKIMPTPDEIEAGWYRILYNTLRRCALNSAYQQRNGNGKTETGEIRKP